MLSSRGNGENFNIQGGVGNGGSKMSHENQWGLESWLCNITMVFLGWLTWFG